MGMTRRAAGLLAATFLTMGVSAQNPHVHIHGALQNMMMHGDISPQARLADYSGTPGWWGLGAVAGLQGEVLIWDGQPWVAAAEADKVALKVDPGAQATLLVAAQVERWTEVAIPKRVTTQAKFEAFLAKAAAKAGLDVAAPFPFRVTGPFDELAWHVVDWTEGDMEHTCEKHKTTGPHGVERGVEAQLLGFHSDRHHRIFTHHSTNLHMHAWIGENDVMAHVDGMTLARGATLMLPLPEAN